MTQLSTERATRILEQTKLKEVTLIDSNIELISNRYHYVNRLDKLASTSFDTKEDLIRNKDCIRFDNMSIILMRERYNYFVKSK